MASRPTPLTRPGTTPPRNTFVLPEHKIVYLSLTKAANTSLRWMVADLAGEDFTRFYRAPGNHTSRLMTIHAQRSTWQHVLNGKEMSAEQLAEISRDRGWFVFAVTRDPWTRLFSAWASKLLVRHGNYTHLYLDEPWFPRVPTESGQILEDWHTFLAARAWETNESLAADPHFAPQVRSIHPDRINYTRLYDLTEMPVLLADLRAHLASIGRSQELYLPRSNESPVPLRREFFVDGVAELIERSYARDFEALGDRWNFADLRFSDDPITQDAVRGIAAQVEANQRIDDLSLELISTRRERDRLEAQLAKASAPGRPLIRRVAGRLPPPVRRELRRLRHRAGTG